MMVRGGLAWLVQPVQELPAATGSGVVIAGTARMVAAKTAPRPMRSATVLRLS